jgi:hypothetical protein
MPEENVSLERVCMFVKAQVYAFELMRRLPRIGCRISRSQGIQSEETEKKKSSIALLAASVWSVRKRWLA